MSDPDRDALRRAFAELRAADRRSLPAFDTLVARPRHRIPPLVATPGAVVLAAVLVVVAVVVVRRSQVVPPAPPLSAWQAPTDVLLHTPGIEVLRSVPSISASVVDRLGTSVNNQHPESQ
jgi:hypothetical protein